VAKYQPAYYALVRTPWDDVQNPQHNAAAIQRQHSRKVSFTTVVKRTPTHGHTSAMTSPPFLSNGVKMVMN
jgi:hypothetical protein